MLGKLYLVSTPIGNLGDITYRSVKVLGDVDFIAAEDTRVSLKLLNHLEIKKPMISYYEHNKKFSGEKIIARLQSGESCALITDAGTPAISDPGEDIVRLCAQAGIDVVPVPGACAAVSALSASGLPTQRFCFEGFLSRSRKSRYEHLQDIAHESRTMIFYEAPHKLMKTLEDMLNVLGDREISLCREITKLHEQILRTTIKGAVEYFTKTPPKGEFVLVIAGEKKSAEKLGRDAAVEIVMAYRNKGHSLKQAAKMAEQETGCTKNELYAMIIDAD